MKNLTVCFVLSFLAVPVASLDLPAHLWSCHGEVHYAETPDQPERVLEPCGNDMNLPLPAGSRLRVIKGSALLTDGTEKVVLDPRNRPLHRVKSQAAPEQESWLRSLLSYLAGSRTDKHLLKGDESQLFGRYPYLEITTADGPLLAAWQGLAVWHNLPPDRPLALRVSSGEELVWGPQVLIEPVFDLGELANLGIEAAHLELMVIDSPYLPSEGTLRFPLGRLLALRGKPVPAVVLAELRLATPEERAALNRPLTTTGTAEPALLVAARAVEENRLRQAREVLQAEYGLDLPLPWQRALSGLEVVGDLSIAAPAVSLCVGVEDPDALWRCFWDELGPAVVPEIPPADLPAVAVVADRLAELEPHGWRGLVAPAQVDLLRTEHRSARRKLESAMERCGASESCTATVTLLENLVEVDSHSTMSRGVSQKSMSNVEPELLLNLNQRSARRVRAWDRVDPAAKRAGGLWRMAADVRWHRGGLEALRYQLKPQQFAEIARKFRDGILEPGDEDPAVDLLRWSVYADEKPPRLPRELRAVAHLLHAEALLAPDGSFGATDVDRPPDAPVFQREGLSSPSLAVVDAASFERGYETLAYHRGSASPVLAARRLMLVAQANTSLGETEAARKLLDQAELFLRSDAPAQDRAGLKLLRSHLASENGTTASLEFLGASVEIAQHAGSPGRVKSVLATWDELARQAFHHRNRYRDGLLLLDGAVETATTSGFLLPAMEMNVATLTLLGELNLYGELLRKVDRARSIGADLRSAMEEKNAAIVARVQSGELPEAVTQLTSMRAFHALTTQIETQALTAMAHLGRQWHEIKEIIERYQQSFRKMVQGLVPETSVVNLADALSGGPWQVMVAIARADFRAAEKLAADSNDPFLRGIFSLARGDHGLLRTKERQIDRHQQLLVSLVRGDLDLLRKGEAQIDRYHKILAALPPVPQPTHNLDFAPTGTSSLVRQLLLQARELYFQLSAQAQDAGQTRKQLEAWDADELSGKIRAARPWRRQHLEAQVLEAEGNLAQALQAYDTLMEELLRQFFGGQYRNLHVQYVRAQEDAYLGSARTAWGLSLADATHKALDRVDALAWLGGERALFGTRNQELVPLPDLEEAARGLGEQGRLVVVSSFGRPRETMVWVYSTDAGLEARDFVAAEDELFFKEALKLSVGQEPASPTVERMAAWLASKVPRDAPVALVAGGELRKLGLHLLPIDGVPWALRNPLTLAPSLRSLAAAQQSKRRGRGRAVVGLPLDENGNPGAYEPLEDHDRLRELAAGGTLLWDEEATVEGVETVLKGTARVHLSTHGVVDAIDQSRTGLKLYQGQMLNLERANRVELPGSLVILSACQSSDWGDPSAQTVSTLDRIFLARGASSVVSTTDQVKPEVAARWMDRFHAALDAGEAPMRAAQMAYRTTRERFSNPWEWGAFVVVGSGVGEF